MTQYGDKQEPGIVTHTTSNLSDAATTDAPNDAGVVAHANLGGGAEQGSADPNTVYGVQRASNAESWFGSYETSRLTQVVVDAIREGASPVFAAAPSATSVTGEDHGSTSSTTVTLDNTPIREDLSDMSVSLDGTDLTLVRTWEDVGNKNPDAGEAYVNPKAGEVQVPSTPSTSLSVDYDYFDYTTAVQAMGDDAGDTIDFFGCATEASSPSSALVTEVNAMADLYNLAIAIVGVDSYVDPSSVSVDYDDSRVQALAGTRYENGDSLMGGYLGLKAATGLETTVINKSLNSADGRTMLQRFTRSERGSLADANIVPIAPSPTGPRVADDPTTVTDSNTDEQNIQYGYSRSAFDYVIDTVQTNQQPFIGKLNRPETRNTLQALVNNQLTQLAASNVLLSYSVNVFPVDATTVEVEVALDVADPLRYVENTLTLA
jgi:hypothetical protein